MFPQSQTTCTNKSRSLTRKPKTNKHNIHANTQALYKKHTPTFFKKYRNTDKNSKNKYINTNTIVNKSTTKQCHKQMRRRTDARTNKGSHNHRLKTAINTTTNKHKQHHIQAQFMYVLMNKEVHK